jgi:hypothetical protein
MRVFLLIAMFLSASSAFAQLRCVDKLLPIPRPSASHQLASGEWTPAPGDVLTIEGAEQALKSLVFTKLLCRENEIEFAVRPICTTLDPTAPDSHTCFAPSSLGHFIITQDNAKNANLIFHKMRRQRRD